MKKAEIIILSLFIVSIFYQSYLHITEDSNTTLVVGALNSKTDKNNRGLATLYINDNLVDTINFKRHFAYRGKHTLPLGKNSVTIRDIEHKSILYKTTITYIGLYTWCIMQCTSQSVLMEKCYIQPRFR